MGKSTLLTNLAGVYSEVAAYEFTTLTTVPGVIRYKGAKVQVKLFMMCAYTLPRKYLLSFLSSLSLLHPPFPPLSPYPLPLSSLSLPSFSLLFSALRSSWDH